MAEIIDALRRDGDSSNSIIGIVILVLMSVFVAPDVLPQLVSESVPFLEQGLPCSQVMNAQDRANHQSLIGRGASNPLQVSIEVGNYPTDGTRPLVIRVIVINNTIGSVPFVFDPNQVITVDDPSSSGIGLIFTPSLNISLDTDENGIPNQRVVTNTFSSNSVKVLGPRQRCVHRIEIPPGQLPQPNTRVRAYYRITNVGTVQQVNPQATPVFTNQGLAIVSGGFVESPDAVIPFSATAGGAQ